MAMDRTQTRNNILDAAHRVLTRCGLAKTTIEAVAVEAAMSKGGVLHYFASKRDLLMAVLHRFETYYFEQRDALAARLPEAPGRLARATLMVMVASRKEMASAAHYRLDMYEDLEYREKIGDMKRRMFADILAGARNPEKVAMILYLLDGLWLDKLFRPGPIPTAVGNASRKYLDDFLKNMQQEYE